MKKTDHFRRFVPLIFILVMAAGCIPATMGSHTQPARGEIPTIVPTIPPGEFYLPQVLMNSNPNGQAMPGITASQNSEHSQQALTPSAPSLDAACVVGSWEVANMAQSMTSALAKEQAGLALQGVAGRARYTFSPDGTIGISFERLETTLHGTVENRPVTAVQSLDGSATAQYVVDSANRQIILSHFAGDGIQFALDVNGHQLASGNLPAWQAFTSGLGGDKRADDPPQLESARADLTCAGDTMQMRMVGSSFTPQIDLQRIH